MKIIVLGAGQVGSTVAETLSSEANDITIVDHDAEASPRPPGPTRRPHGDRQRLPSRAFSHRRGPRDADLILAVTSSDETNMVACQVAYTLFQTPTKIARVRAADYLEHPSLFCSEALPVDVHISPEQLVTDYIQRLIESPGALQVLDFAKGKVRLVAVQRLPRRPPGRSRTARVAVPHAGNRHSGRRDLPAREARSSRRAAPSSR